MALFNLLQDVHNVYISIDLQHEELLGKRVESCPPPRERSPEVVIETLNVPRSATASPLKSPLPQLHPSVLESNSGHVAHT